MRSSHCARVRRILPFHLEGEASPEDSLHAARHLAACARCRAEQDREIRLASAMTARQIPPPPRDIAGGVTEALRALRGAVSPRAMKWSALGAMFAALAVPGLRPWELSAVAWNFIVRMGELVNAEEILSRLSGLIPKLFASPIPLIDSLVSGQPASGSPGAVFPGQPAIFLLFMLAATLLAAVFSGCAMLGGFYLARPHR